MAIRRTCPCVAPSAKWVVEFHKDMCVASRAFGVANDEFTFAIRPIALNPVVELAVLTRNDERTFAEDGKVRITPGPDGTPIDTA